MDDEIKSGRRRKLNFILSASILHLRCFHLLTPSKLLEYVKKRIILALWYHPNLLKSCEWTNSHPKSDKYCTSDEDPSNGSLILLCLETGSVFIFITWLWSIQSHIAILGKWSLRKEKAISLCTLGALLKLSQSNDLPTPLIRCRCSANARYSAVERASYACTKLGSGCLTGRLK